MDRETFIWSQANPAGGFAKTFFNCNKTLWTGKIFSQRQLTNFEHVCVHKKSFIAIIYRR